MGLDNQRIKKFSTEENFNIFNLHKDIDRHPRSWICVKGEGIKDIIREIEAKIIKEKGFSRESLAKLLSKRLNCNFNSFKYIFRGEKEYYPIPFIKELINISGNKEYLKKVHSRIQYLKVNSAISKKVKCIKNLTPDLYKILGAFMADGSLTVTIQFASKNKFDLEQPKKFFEESNTNYNEWYCKSREEHSLGIAINQKNWDRVNQIISLNKITKIQSHYNLEISDEHQSNLESFRKWVLNSFNVLPNSFKEKRGAWRLTYSNKIVARYLMTFFDVVPGPKTYTAFEPTLIKDSPLDMRKLFARGVLMFDGSFTSAGKLTFSTKSRDLFESIKDITKKDDLAIGITRNRGDFAMFTYEKTSKQKILSYFEKETHKWLRVKDFLETRNRSIEELIKRYKIYPNNKITFEKLYDLIKDIKSCDLEYLSNYFKCSKHIIKAYLIILKNSRLISFSKNPVLIKKRFVKSSTQILLKENIHNFIFDKIKEECGTYKNFCDSANIHKATISAWKLRKSRINLSILEKICRLCNIDFSIVLNNVKEADRKIIEIV